MVFSWMKVILSILFMRDTPKDSAWVWMFDAEVAKLLILIDLNFQISRWIKSQVPDWLSIWIL